MLSFAVMPSVSFDTDDPDGGAPVRPALRRARPCADAGATDQGKERETGRQAVQEKGTDK